MRKNVCISLLLLAAILQAAGTAHARNAESAAAQETDSTGVAAGDSTGVAAGDSSAVAVPDTTVGKGDGSTGLLTGRESQIDGAELPAEKETKKPWVEPVWRVEYEATESAYRTGTGFTLNFALGRGWRASSNLRMAKRKYRGRDMSDINETFNNTAAKIVPSLYDVNFGIGQDYLRQKAVGLARSGGDMVIQNKFVNAGFRWQRSELRAKSSQFAVIGRAGEGQNDFKYDNNFQGQASAHLLYGFGPALDISGGYGIWRRTEDSDVAGRKFENMPSNMDTISAKVNYGSEARKLLHLDYKRTIGVVRKVDPPRGNSLEVIENPDLAQMEESSRKLEKVLVKSSIQPLSVLTLDFQFVRDYFDQQNVVDDRLSKETELKTIKANATYKYASSGRMTFDINRRENDVDYGPVSLSSYLEKEGGVKVSLNQSITDSLRITLMGSGSLKQRFYVKRDANPRDADYLNYFFQADFDARLPFNIETGVKFTYRQYETINIDASLSGDNRTDYTYWVVPRFQLKPAKWFEIGQDYEIKMEFTDFAFNDNENYLDRTIMLSTNARFRFYRSNLAIRHMYRFIDSGSYLLPPEGGERLYGRTNESFEHRLSFRYEYKPAHDFSLFSNSNYRFQESSRLGEVDGEIAPTSTKYYDSGEMSLGLKRTTRVTKSGKIDMNIGWVRRFGPNLTEERREFWDIDFNIEIKF